MSVPSFEDSQALHRAGQLQEAKLAYQSLLKQNPNDTNVLHWLGVLYAEEGEVKTAIECLQKAYTLAPDDITIALHYANILKANLAHQKALEVLKRLQNQQPNFPAVYNNLGTLYFLQEKYEEAIVQFQQALNLQTNYIDAYYNLGLAFNKLKRHVEARQAYEAILALAKDHPAAKFQLGLLLMQEHLYEKAIELFKQILATYPYHVESQLNLATCYIKLGKLIEAKENYLKVIALNPNDIQTLFNLGVLAMQAGHLQEAVDYYSQTAHFEPNNFDAQNNLGFAYLMMRNRQQALLHFREALRIDPNNAAVSHTINILAQDKKLTASPKEYIQSLFDSYADHYDAHLVQILKYRVPELFYELIIKFSGDTKRDILDLGCGTGLCGEILKPIAKSLVGVDISEKMLEIAREKNIFDELMQSDLLPFLNNHPDAYDLIVAGDVIVYFGDLTELLPAVAETLRAGGLFVFNAEINESEDFKMTDSGRFTQSRFYLDKLAKQSGLTIKHYEKAALRTQDQAPVYAHVYVLEKTH